MTTEFKVSRLYSAKNYFKRGIHVMEYKRKKQDNVQQDQETGGEIIRTPRV
jgi:hypothetical protein